MDKYTVDLDQVLNDFEYSEYSLESAKLNRTVQEELPNTSFNSNYSNKNDTTVKHSINNVFHSLNEYLSSDITPRKSENVLNTPKNVNLQRDLQSSSFAGTTNTFLPHVQKVNIHENSAESPKYHLTKVESEIDLPERESEISNKNHDYFDAFKYNLVEKTDIFNEIDNGHEKRTLYKFSKDNTDIQVETKTSDFNTNSISSGILKDADNIELQSTSKVDKYFIEIQDKPEDIDCLDFKNEISEEILVDLGSISDICDTNYEDLQKNEDADSENKEITEQIVTDECEVKEIESVKAEPSEQCYPKTDEIEVLNEEICDSQNANEEKSKIFKIGFENNVVLDEENLDQYFQELEQEFGEQIEEIQNESHNIEDLLPERSKIEDSEMLLTELDEKVYDLKDTDLELGIKDEHSAIESKMSRPLVEVKKEVELKEEEEAPLDSEKCEPESSESKLKGFTESALHENVASSMQKNVETESSSLKNDKITIISPVFNKKNVNLFEVIVTEETEDPQVSKETPEDVIIEKTKEDQIEGTSKTEKQEVEKNCRPQNLIFSEEIQDATRKINLIGDPGSTPYNNVYSTRDFEKNNLKEEGSGDNSVRPASPTYSDVSTDSVSSSSSDDAEYNDAVSDIHGETKNLNENTEIHETTPVQSKITIQNNMISSGETCRSDVTTDKDFKNNLKTSNLEELGEASRSNVPIEEGEKSCNTSKDDVEEESPRVNEEASNNASEELEAHRNDEEANTDQARSGESAASSLGINWLGKQAPLWIPDNEAMSCLHCDMKFTVLKRRHHCRACGLVLCSKCCNLQHHLEYLDADARVCKKCYDILDKDSSSDSEISQESSSPSRNLNASRDATNLGQPNPNNPLEYCSTVPPLQQVDLGASATPSVLVPVGVLKRKGSNKARSNKSVMFCDGIRPGSDLTNLDTDFNYSDLQRPEKSKKAIEKSSKSGKNLNMFHHETRSFIPSDEESLPPTVTIFKSDIKYSPCANNSSVVEMLRNEPLIFALQSNVFVHVKIIKMDCCVNRTAWCFSTEGLINVGQDELVILLELIENEAVVPKDIFIHLNNIYLEAVKARDISFQYVYGICHRRVVCDLAPYSQGGSGSLISSRSNLVDLLSPIIDPRHGSQFTACICVCVVDFHSVNTPIIINYSSVKELGLSLHTSSPFLGSKNHAGFVYIRPTFQCLQNVIVPKEPYLIGILIHRWETPWAKLFPLRLVLRLGAEYKYYPSPIISTRERDSVFVEIGHTIINLLADFRNFTYTLPQIRGLTIHMEDKNTTVTIPLNRYDQVMKGLCNSSDHILAFAGNFSTCADSHLVCIQDTASATNNYSTHAINICNQPRKVTGASFIVFNGALKSTSGLTAKSNIVEDGLMIQILPEHMLQVRESLRNMKDHTIKCGCVNEESYETVTIVWGEPDCTFNVGVLSPIDNKIMIGIPSIRVHNGKDYTCNSGSRLIRWTEVFIIQSGEETSRNQDPVDISKISENIAKATCQALVKYLDLLVSNSFYKIGLRANLHVENVSYAAGSNNVKLPPIYMKSLDNELIPVLHRITSNNITEQPIILELIFRILNV